MCGLVGIFDTAGSREISEPLLTGMCDRLLHRGPDGGGIHRAPGIGLGHRRLAIVDLAGGAQPLFNEDGSVAVVFNGEIYNFRGLADELERLGHVFSTRSDTEVIVHGWEEWGADCVTRFNGMFAFALWDAGTQTLFLARDRLGKKPLYYAELPDGRLLFASELKALLACPELPRDIDPLAVEDYLCFGYVPDPRSIYRGISKLPPAHRLLWRRGGRPRIDAYWRPSLEGRMAALDEAVAELSDRFRQAVADRLIADVPLGAFLSGGVDSSGVVALMAGLIDEPVNTFSIAFNEPRFDESAHARAISARYGTRHSQRLADPTDLGLFERLLDIFDEPFGDNSALPTLKVCALAREQVTVALSGDGGDEALAGYRRYRWHLGEERVRGLLPAGLRGPLFGLLARVYPKLDWAPRCLRAKTTFGELAVDGLEAYANSVAVIGEPLRQSLYSPAFRSELQGYRAVETLRRHWDDADTEDPLRRVQYVDLKTWLAGDILVKVDRTSMAVSLEVRAPLLDHRLVEWALGLPAGLKIHQGQGKWLLKQALESYVPRDLLYRPKQGFSSPLAAWFRGPLAGRMAAAAERLGASGYFDAARLRAIVAQHRCGLRDHGPTLWSLVMLDGFLQRYGGVERNPTLPLGETVAPY
jgi:asparagine synthase (glutamine-hydrolysing)